MRRLTGLFLLGAVFVLILLLARNPYGLRTLIPNLEPYPDTLHYVVPARSLASGGPFAIVREGRILRPSVPPLYSLTLTPFYLINEDPRTYYFANVLFTLISTLLLWLILKRLKADRWIIGLTLFLFVTNFYVYWYPQWAMAENLILPLFFGSVYLLVLPINKKTIILASLIPVLVYGTKYAYLPYIIAYLVMFSLKIYLEAKRRKLKSLVTFVLLTGIFFVPVLLYQFLTQTDNPFSGYLKFFVGVLNGSGGEVVENKFLGPKGWYSKEFFLKNFPLYLRGLFGEKTRLLWDFTPILPKYLLYPAWAGLLVGVIKRRYRVFSFSLLVLLLFHLFVISAFSTLDMRYIYHAMPTFLLSFSLMLIFAKEILVKRKLYWAFLLLIFLIGSLYAVKNVQRLRFQAVLNLKYAETPWYYISVLKLNDNFSNERVLGEKKPYVISPMPPYYIDFYANGNYRLLPLARDQEFRTSREATWGPNDYSNFHTIYKKYLSEGYELYVSTYGLGNEGYLHLAFDNLYKDFDLTEVQNECYTQCKIYKMKLKNAKSN